MANKIGIVLALDGEQKFTQGMKNAQQSAKLLKTNLTQLSTEFKGNANSMEALRAKQEALKNLQEGYARVLTAAKTGQSQAKKAYQEQAKAVEKLRKEYDDAKKALDQMEKEGKQGTDAYKKQKAEVDKLSKAVDQQTANYLKAEGRLTQWDARVAQAESDIKKNSAALEQNSQYLDEAAKSADGCATSIDKMGDEVQDTTDDLDEGGKSLKDFLMYTAGNLAASAIKEVGQMAKEAAKYVIDVGSKFEASMSKVAALSGASTTELSQMEEMAKQLGSSTMFSASEVADGFSYMALAGWNANQSIAAMPGILDLAAASNMDLAEASDMVTDYLSAFGMEASEAGKMADMMAYAQANSNTSTQQLGEAFGNCAANMHAAGQDMATTTSFLEAFANQGVKGSEAGTKLAAIMRDITAKMKDGKIQIGDTAVAVQDSEGNFRDLTDIMMDVEAATDGMGTAERSAALAATFTSKSVGGLNMILAEGVDNIADYEKQLNNADGAASSMAKTMQDNLAGKVTAFDSAMEGLGIALYSYFSGPLSGAVGLATNLIQGITAALTPQKSELETFTDDIAAMNEQVKQSIANASQTVENGQQKAATIAAFGEEMKGILTSCEEYNKITLADGTTEIVSSTGEVVIGFKEIDGQIHITEGELAGFDTTGLSVEQIISQALSAQNSIGYIADELEDTESKLQSFGASGIDITAVQNGTSAIIEMVDGAGESVGTFVSKVSDIGDIEIPTQNIHSGTDVIVSYIDDVTGAAETARGKITDTGNVDIPDAKIREGTDAVVKLFNNAGVEIGEFRTDVENIGNIQIPIEGSGIDESTKAIITCWDDASKSVQSFETSVSDLNNSDNLNLSNISEQFDIAASSIRHTYHVTDEFTKMRISSFVSEFGGVVKGLASAWDENTSSLTASKDELENWFGVAQQVAMYDAYKSAANKLYKAYADAWVDITKSQSAEIELLKQINDEAGTTYGSYEEYLAGVASGEILLTGAAMEAAQKLHDQHAKTEEYVGVMGEAKEAIDTTGKALNDAADALNGMGVEVDETTGEIVAAGEATEDAGTATEDFTEDTEDATDAVKTYADAVGDMEAKTKSAYDSAKQAVTDYFAHAKESAESAFRINPFSAWEVDQENGLAKMREAFDSQISNMQSYAQNLETVSQYVGTQVTPEFMQYLQDLGTDGAQAMQELADALSNGDTAKVEELMQAYTEAMDIQDEIANVTALNATMFALGMNEFGSSPDEWAKVKNNISKFSEGVDADLKSELDSAIETAQKLGVKIPDELADSIENGDKDPTQAVQDITALIQSAIDGQADSLAAAAQAAGFTVPENFEQKIKEGGPAAQQAWEELIASVTGTEVDTTGAETAGTETAGAFSDSISEGQGDAQSAAETVSEAAGTAIATAVEKFRSAGTLAGVSFRTAITGYSDQVNSAADAMATGAATAAGNHTGEFSNAGSSSSQGFVSGMNSVDATSAGNTLASSALNGASGYYQSFYSIGSNLGSGLNAGISAWTSTIAETAAAAVTNAAAAARAAADVNSPSKLFRDQVGKPIGEGIAVGIEKTSGLSVDAAEAQMNQVLARLQQWIGRNRKQIEATGATMSDAVSYGWQTLANQQLDIGFGIAKTTTTGTGDDKKTEKKSAETYSKEVYQAAKQYMDNVKVLFDVSDAEEEKYWTNVQKHLTRGTQAWFDATERINELRKSQAEAAQRAAEEEAEAAQRAAEEEAEAAQKAAEEEAEAAEERKRAIEQANADILSNAETTMCHQQILHDVSLQEQLEYWQSVRKQLIKGSEEWYDATATIKDIRKQIREEQAETRKQAAEAQAQTYADILSNAQEYVSRQKARNKMSIQEEEQYWIEIRKQLKKGSEEYKKATENILAARAQVGLVSTAETMLDTYQTYFDMSARAEMQYWAAVRKQYRAGTEERLKADKQYFAAQKNYTSQLTKLSEDYANNKASIIKSRDDQIAEAEEKLADRIKSINTQLADDIAKVNENRYNRIKELHENYRNAVASRKDEILHSFDIFSAFESSSATGADLLFNMQSQAAGYEDWAASIKKLRKKGVLSDALMSEIEAKGPQDSAAVHALLQLSKSQLQQYQDAYDRREAVAQAQAEKENAQLLKDTAAEIREVKAAAKDEIAKLREAAKADRAAARSETKAEIKSLKTETSAKLKELKSTYVSNKNELKTAIDKDILGLAKSIKTIASDETTKLIAALYQPVVKSTSKKTTTSKSLASAFASLINGNAFASGTPALKDWYAWMDEAGIGSEMIVRKSDGARLNTNVQPGDAIVPAASTANLWDWSELNPKDLISGLRAQQASLSAYINDVMSGVASMAALNARVLTSGGSMMNGGNDAGSQLMMSMLALMQQYMPYMAERQTLSVDGRELASATSEYMSEELAMRSRRRRNI